MSNLEGGPQMGNQPKTDYAVTEDGQSLDRRAFLKNIGLGFGALAATAALGSSESDARERRNERSGQDQDPERYIESTKRLIESAYESVKESIHKEAVRMQVEFDGTGKKPNPFRKDIPLPESAQEMFSSARLELSYEREVDGNPTYKVQFLVTERRGGDIDCGSRPLTLRKKK